MTSIARVADLFFFCHEIARVDRTNALFLHDSRPYCLFRTVMQFIIRRVIGSACFGALKGPFNLVSGVALDRNGLPM